MEGHVIPPVNRELGEWRPARNQITGASGALRDETEINLKGEALMLSAPFPSRAQTPNDKPHIAITPSTIAVLALGHAVIVADSR